MNYPLSTFPFGSADSWLGHKNFSTRAPRGFTLVEMIVSLGIFTIVLFIATSAFLTVVNADRKSRAVRIATDNLNLTLEDMSRKIKTGTTYNCGGGAGTNDCPVTPSNSFSFNDQSTPPKRIVYKRMTETDCGTGHQGCILRSDDNGVTFIPITSPEIDIKGLDFIVRGSLAGDTAQPSVLVLIDGSLSSGPNTPATTFKIQTLITQRAYDN